LDGAAYVFYRPNGGAAGDVFPFFDMSLPEGLPTSVGLSGYGGQGVQFLPYLEFLNADRSAVLAVAGLNYNPINDRWEVNGFTSPAGTAWLRLVVRGSFDARSTYHDIVWWGINVERGPNATPLSDTSSVRLPAQSVEYNNGLQLNSLRPAEFGSNVTETRVASAITGQGTLATRNEITASVGNGMRFTDNLIPDNEYKDLAWWGASGLPNFYFMDVPAANWSMPRTLEFAADRDFDFSSQFFTLERGSTYRIRCRIWNNNTAAGWSGAFWPMLHIPSEAWFSLKHGYSINPEVADAANAIVANGDVIDQEFYFTPQSNAARAVQFRFKSTARGSQVAMQFHISKVQRLGRDLIRSETNLPYVTSDIQTNLGTASSITGQGDLATRNQGTLPFGGANAVVNSEFTRGKFGWRAGNGTLDTQWGVNLPGWFGQRNVIWATASGTLAANSVRDISPDALWEGGGLPNAPKFALPVVGGDRVCATVLAAPHRCTFQLYILIFDGAGTLVSAPEVSGGTPGGAANGDPANFTRLTVFADAPSNARWAIPMMRMLGTGESDPYIFFTEPMLSKVAAGQTTAPRYSAGRSDPNADVTATVSGPADLVMSFRSDLTLTSPLPITGEYELVEAGGGLVTSGVNWTVTVISGTFAGSAPTVVGIGAAQLRLNSAMTSPEVQLRITPTVAGRSLPPFVVVVRRQVAPPSSTPLTSFNSDTFAIVHEQPIQITLPSTSTSVTLTAVSDLLVDPTSPQGGTLVEGKWQRESTPGTWVDVGATASASPPPEVFMQEPFPGEVFYTAEPGSIVCNRTATGLPAGSIQRFRFVARISNGNIRTVRMVGNASATS
jgi:hypothetical protein